MRHIVLTASFLLLVACGGDDDPKLLNAASATGNGPDEFSVLPAKPLVIPTNFNDLPPPTPGGGNLTDPTPQADAIVALGGDPGVLSRGVSDGALIAYTGRFGVAPGIRARLAAEDLAFRRNNDAAFFERLFNVNVYFRVYQSQALDQYAELERMRRAGVRTPSAPPEPDPVQ